MEHCYWDDTGKYQKLANELDEKAPMFGYTSNTYVNLYLAMVHLYYDAYNNGGVNIADCYMPDLRNNVIPHLPNISAYPFIHCKYETMEQMMDQALEYIRDKDLSFPVYTVWFNHDRGLLSHVQPPADKLDGWAAVTFGEKDLLNDYCTRRMGNSHFHDVTEEVRASNDAHFKLDSAIQNAAENSTKGTAPAKSSHLEGR